MVDGSEVPLILPPQGGKVMFIGVRAQNLDGCPLNIGTALRDTNTNTIVTLERRPVRMEENDDGFLLPRTPAAITNYSNLPGCPRAGLSQDVHGVPHELTISVEDQDGRTAELTLTIVPTCAQPEFFDQCVCECDSDYTLGQDCSAASEG